MYVSRKSLVALLNIIFSAFPLTWSETFLDFQSRVFDKVFETAWYVSGGTFCSRRGWKEFMYSTNFAQEKTRKCGQGAQIFDQIVKRAFDLSRRRTPRLKTMKKVFEGKINFGLWVEQFWVFSSKEPTSCFSIFVGAAWGKNFMRSLFKKGLSSWSFCTESPVFHLFRSRWNLS